MTRSPLKAYEAKRRFGRTPEPPPGRGGRPGKRLAFVVQKHAARALHYDLRLELGGVLKSWAVPKGPSLDPKVRRLAVMVEDHPLEYGDFEGIIPKGNYGAGSVAIWDRGTYRHPEAATGADGERALAAGLRKGDLKFVLEGEKLRGEFALVKTAKDDTSWLLIKKRDRFAAPALEGAPPAPLPRRMRPMLAATADKPFDDPDWLFEVKWDGYRAVAEVERGRVVLRSRNLLPLNARFPAIAEALEKIGGDAVLDGEIVVLDARGRPDFQLLQNRRSSRAGHLVYYVFDLPYFEGRDLTGLPLVRRKEILEGILPRSPLVRFSEHVRGEGRLFFDAVRTQGLEGIMAKHAQSPYRPGTRSSQWLKVKTRLTQEAVIAGFTAPRGARRHFGALVLGAFAEGGLTYIGNVGGGLDAKGLANLRRRLEPLIRKRSPFAAAPDVAAPVTWVKPELVCEVVFAEWTADGVMRQPVFLRLREDKAPREVVVERPATRRARGGETP
ncbi:MAG TPA: non-homologous end-joining DNA ligase [bacterium]